MDKKIGLLILPLLFLSGCQPTEYELISFPTEEVAFLSDYKIQLLNATFADVVQVQNETSQDFDVNASNGKQFLVVSVKMRRFVVLEQSVGHILDEDDFRIKDHVGIKQPSVFDTEDAGTDYSWKNHSFEPGSDPFTFNVTFELPLNVTFTSNRIVLEVDFFAALGNSVDVPLTNVIE